MFQQLIHENQMQLNISHTTAVRLSDEEMMTV